MICCLRRRSHFWESFIYSNESHTYGRDLRVYPVSLRVARYPSRLHPPQIPAPPSFTHPLRLTSLCVSLSRLPLRSKMVASNDELVAGHGIVAHEGVAVEEPVCCDGKGQQKVVEEDTKGCDGQGKKKVRPPVS